jgi:hypothetical protein
MEYHKRIPTLIIPEAEIDFPLDEGWKERKIHRCDNCGNALFYLAGVKGLVRYKDFFRNMKVAGETKESKKYRNWEISQVAEERYCAICNTPGGTINIVEDKDIAHYFDDLWSASYYEDVLDLLQYPNRARKGQLLRSKKDIEKVKKWIADHEKDN